MIRVMNNDIKQVAIYARVSTKDKGQEVANQLRQLRDYCSKQGWAVVNEYVDRASGKRSDREQFQAMFAGASRREFDCVLFWSLDRFSREGTLETLTHLQRLTGYNVSFKSFTEQYLDGTGLFRDAIIGILAALAKQERVRLSERVQAGLARARAHGRVGGRTTVDRAEDRDAAKIRELRSEGQSYAEIGEELGRSKSDIYRVCMTLDCAAQ